MSEHEIESKVRELRQLQSLIEEAQTEAETIKDAIKTFMGDLSELRAGEYKVTWKPVESVRIDARAPLNARCRNCITARDQHKGGRTQYSTASRYNQGGLLMELHDLNQHEREIILLMREAGRNASPDERHAIIEAVKNALKEFPSEED